REIEALASARRVGHPEGNPLEAVAAMGRAARLDAVPARTCIVQNDHALILETRANHRHRPGPARGSSGGKNGFKSAEEESETRGGVRCKAGGGVRPRFPHARGEEKTMHEVREFAGHSDIRTTELYFVRREEDAEVAARKIQIRRTGRKGE